MAPRWFEAIGRALSSNISTAARHRWLQALIGGMKYCRRKLKGPRVKIIHDMHIFRPDEIADIWIRRIIKTIRLQLNYFGGGGVHFVNVKRRGSWGHDVGERVCLCASVEESVCTLCYGSLNIPPAIWISAIIVLKRPISGPAGHH